MTGVQDKYKDQKTYQEKQLAFHRKIDSIIYVFHKISTSRNDYLKKILKVLSFDQTILKLMPIKALLTNSSFLSMVRVRLDIWINNITYISTYKQILNGF